MVIQRWQSVFLLLASIMMGIFCVLPLATQGNVDFYPYQTQIAYPHEADAPNICFPYTAQQANYKTPVLPLCWLPLLI